MSCCERNSRLAMHLGVLSRSPGFRKNIRMLTYTHEDFKSKMIAYAADVKDAIKRLANIAAAQDGTLDDHETSITDLES